MRGQKRINGQDIGERQGGNLGQDLHTLGRDNKEKWHRRERRRGCEDVRGLTDRTMERDK